jgi:hypothetical protein
MFKVFIACLRLSTQFFEHLKNSESIYSLCNEYLKLVFLRYSFLCTEYFSCFLKYFLAITTDSRITYSWESRDTLSAAPLRCFLRWFISHPVVDWGFKK